MDTLSSRSTEPTKINLGSSIVAVQSSDLGVGCQGGRSSFSAMAPRVVRRQSSVNTVPDSESDDEDHGVVRDSVNNAQPINLSDDEDVIPPPLRVPIPQQVPAARHPVGELLRSRGVTPRTEWLESCLNELAVSHSGFAGLPIDQQAELCFAQFLMADFNVAGAASLPPSMDELHGTELPGPFVLQVDEVTDISHSLRDRYQEKSAGTGRTLKLSMTDGVQHVSGMEYRPIKALQVLSPAGIKISLKNVCVRHGLLMLVPEILEILGGCVEHLDSARQRAVQLITNPPRGRRNSWDSEGCLGMSSRTREGNQEPSLVERATSAAWPANALGGAVGVGPMENNCQPEQHRLYPVSTDAQGNEHTASVSGPGVCHSAREAVQEAHNRYMQQDQPAHSSGQSVEVSHIQHPVRLAPVQQEEQQEPIQQDCSTHQGRESLRDSQVHSGGLETVQQAGHLQVTESTTELIRVSGTHSARLDHVHQAEQRHTMQQGQDAETSRPAASSTVEASTSIQVSGDRNGQFPSTPTLSRLSLQSQRVVQSKLPMAQTMQQPQADDQPHQPHADDPPHRPADATDAVVSVDLDEHQENDLHSAAISSTPPSGVSTFKERVPFTYLAVLKDRTNPPMGQHGVVRDKVKCVVTGVISFPFKDGDEFKLRLHIEDGSLITTAFVQPQLVQRLIGCSREELISGLSNPDTHQEMKDNLIQFQKLLEQFEGLMDVEVSPTLAVTVVEMTNGVQLVDTKLLYDRVHWSMYKPNPGSPTIDLPTP